MSVQLMFTGVKKRHPLKVLPTYCVHKNGMDIETKRKTKAFDQGCREQRGKKARLVRISLAQVSHFLYERKSKSESDDGRIAS